MRNLLLKTTIGILVLFTVLGAGCGQNSGKQTTKNSDSDGTQTESKDTISPKDTFNDTVEVEMDLTDAKLIKIEKQIKSIIEDIFGKIKLNSYFTGISGPGTLLTEYTVNRATKSADISLFADALKNKGYKATMVGVNSGSAIGLFDGKEYNVQISYNVDGQTIGLQFMPAISLPPFDQQQ